MNTTPAPTQAALAGLLVAAAIATWWLGSTRLALADAADASRAAAQALLALWLARATLLALLGLRLGALRGWRPGAAAMLALIAPAWPVMVLAWHAGTAGLAAAVLSEVLLLTAGLALPLVGAGLRRTLPQAGAADSLGTAVGAAMVGGLWLARGQWSALLS